MGSWIVAVFFASLACLWSVSYLLSSLGTKKGKHGSSSLPPGPWGLPILGHLHMLGDLPHRNLQKLAMRYGPIMSLRFGYVPVILISSPEWAELFLKNHDIAFANRPRTQAMNFEENKGMVMAPYGAYWRHVRKICTLELLTSLKIESFGPMRKEEVDNFVELIKEAAESGSTKIDVGAKVKLLVKNMTYRMVLGFKEDRLNIGPVIEEGLLLAGVPNLADYIPYIGALDLQGLNRSFKAVRSKLDKFMEMLIDEHVLDAKELHGQHRDFVDVLLSLMESNKTQELNLDRDNIKAIVLELLAGAMETSTTAIEWITAELLKHPRVMKLVQEELESIVGLDRMVEEKDLVKLDYLNMVIKEGMRLHATFPLLLPHQSLEDTTVNGYFIPKQSTVLVNAWAIGRDPKAWSDNAEEFYPERFIGTSIDLQGQDFQLLPFGSGRRKCPGMQLGLTVIQVVLAQLIHCFNLELTDGMSPDDLNMTEKFGLTLTRADPLVVVPTYRLCTRSHNSA